MEETLVVLQAQFTDLQQQKTNEIADTIAKVQSYNRLIARTNTVSGVTVARLNTLIAQKQAEIDSEQELTNS